MLIDRIIDHDVAMVPRLEAARIWFEDVRKRARQSVWATGGCQSWYLDKTGTPSIDPSTLSELHAQLAEVRFEDFIEKPRTGQLPQAA
jgi:hypothetical protein